MSVGTYIISELFNEAFGRNKTSFAVHKNEEKKANIHFGDVQYVESDTADRMSELGTPIMFSWKLKGGNYNTYDLKGNIVQVGLNDLNMPLASFVDFSRSKEIAISKVAASGGTVKEQFSFADWNIRVRGVLFEMSDKTVTEQQEELLQFEKLCDSIGVHGSLFSSKGIREIVIERLRFRQIPKRPGMLSFSMNCLSDEPNELIINI